MHQGMRAQKQVPVFLKIFQQQYLNMCEFNLQTKTTGNKVSHFFCGGVSSLISHVLVHLTYSTHSMDFIRHAANQQSHFYDSMSQLHTEDAQLSVTCHTNVNFHNLEDNLWTVAQVTKQRVKERSVLFPCLLFTFFPSQVLG